MADRNVNAFDARTFLVDDGVHRERRFTGLSVTNNQFPLATANRHHRVDSFKACLDRLRYRLAVDYTRRHLFDRRCANRLNGALAVDRVAQRIHHTAEQAFAHWNFEDSARTFDSIPFNDMFVIPQHHRANRVPLEIQRQTESVARKFQHLALHGISQTVNARDTVCQADHRTFSAGLSAGIEILDPLLDQFADLRRV